ncbi:uncharacterized protein LOC143239989 isoform X2 [Tachypleus tridentatus]
MSSIQHPHIIHIYEVFENKDKIVLVMQYASGGELYDFLSEKKVLSDSEARRIFRQVATAVYYCHKSKICHRDLKLENVLLDEKGNAKIADFGLSNVFDERHLLNTFCGSPLYASPEIVKGTPYYGSEVDCWSMGVLLYTLVYGAMPFDGSNFKRLVRQISEGDYYEPKKKSEASELIRRLLTVDPTKRATIIDICTDSWVNYGHELSLLQVSEDMANLTPVRIDLLLALAPVSPPPPESGKMEDHPLAVPGVKDEITEEPLQSEDQVAEADGEETNEEDDGETVTNSFAYIDAGAEDQLCNSSADFQNASQLFQSEATDDDFLPSAVAAAMEDGSGKRPAERSFDGSLVRISSLAHQSKKPRKSDSVAQAVPKLTENRNKDSLFVESTANNASEVTSLSLKNENFIEKEDKHENGEKKITDKKHSITNDQRNTLAEKEINEKWSKVSDEESNIKKYSSLKDSSKQDEEKAEKKNFKLSNEKEDKETFSKTELTQQENVKKNSEAVCQDEPVIKSDSKVIARKPGKIAIPKTFETSVASPSSQFADVSRLPPVKKVLQNKLSLGEQKNEGDYPNENVNNHELEKSSSSLQVEAKIEHLQPKLNEKEMIETVNDHKTTQDIKKEKNISTQTIHQRAEEFEKHDETEYLKEETSKSTNLDTNDTKQMTAQGIINNNKTNAKLGEELLSQQKAIDSVNEQPPMKNAEFCQGQSFFNTSKLYSRQEPQNSTQSKAEVELGSKGLFRKSQISKDATEDTYLVNSPSDESESVWGTLLSPNAKKEGLVGVAQKHPKNGQLSSSFKDEVSWRKEVEATLKGLSPDNSENDQSTLSQNVEQSTVRRNSGGPLPITRSYRKFTFNKDGSCVTETGKVYTTPAADGSWTKVEKKTRITKKSSQNDDDFDKIEHLQFRETSDIQRSDSESSSGSNDIFDDIFDTWTGDSMVFNFMKNTFSKIARDPFFHKERRRDPFRQMRKEREQRVNELFGSELRSGNSTDRDSSDLEDDFDVHFDDSHPVMYGSQGLWQLLQSGNRNMSSRFRSLGSSCLTPSIHSLGRSSQGLRGRDQFHLNGHLGREFSSMTRSLSRERNQSPRETVLRFVLDPMKRQSSVIASEPSSPRLKPESWKFKDGYSSTAENTAHRDSGVESCDGYESEFSARTSKPSSRFQDDFTVGKASLYGTIRPRTYQQYIKSFTKDLPKSNSSSNPTSPNSGQVVSQETGCESSQTEEMPESQRKRVEQWLHMSDSFNVENPGNEVSENSNRYTRSQSKDSSASDSAVVYGTIRPRGFIRYNRSKSDKAVDPIELVSETGLQEDRRSFSIQSLDRKGLGTHSQRAVRSTFKTVSEIQVNNEQESGNQHCKVQASSHSSSLGNNVKSSVKNPQHTSSGQMHFVRSLSGTLHQKGGQKISATIPSTGQGRPMFHMRFSFNRNNPEGQVLVTSHQEEYQEPLGSIWQQQNIGEQRGVNQKFSDPFSTPSSSVRNIITQSQASRGENTQHITVELEDNRTARSSERWTKTSSRNIGGMFSDGSRDTDSNQTLGSSSPSEVQRVQLSLWMPSSEENH